MLERLVDRAEREQPLDGGAHLLLQIRTHVLNDDLADDFRHWHPGFAHTTQHEHLAA